MWREVAEELALEVRSPASEDAIVAAEAVVGCRLPDPLRELLLETNGLVGEHGIDVVMTAEGIAEANHQMRMDESFVELYMPFEPLLFFGDAGNGDLFAFPIRAGRADDQCIFVWDHEDDSRATTSASLERYVRGERWHEARD